MPCTVYYNCKCISSYFFAFGLLKEQYFLRFLKQQRFLFFSSLFLSSSAVNSFMLRAVIFAWVLFTLSLTFICRLFVIPLYFAKKNKLLINQAAANKLLFLLFQRRNKILKCGFCSKQLQWCQLAMNLQTRPHIRMHIYSIMNFFSRLTA